MTDDTVRQRARVSLSHEKRKNSSNLEIFATLFFSFLVIGNTSWWIGTKLIDHRAMAALPPTQAHGLSTRKYENQDKKNKYLLDYLPMKFHVSLVTDFMFEGMDYWNLLEDVSASNSFSIAIILPSSFCVLPSLFFGKLPFLVLKLPREAEERREKGTSCLLPMWLNCSFLYFCKILEFFAALCFFLF